MPRTTTGRSYPDRGCTVARPSLSRSANVSSASPLVELAVRVVGHEGRAAALPVGGRRPVAVLYVAAAAQEPETARAAERLPLDRGLAQIATHGARLPDGLEILLPEIAAPQVGHPRHRGRGIHAPVGVETQAAPPRAGQIVLHARPAVEPQPEFIDVVDRDPELGPDQARPPHRGENLFSGRESGQRTVENTAPPVRPQQMDIAHAVGRRQPDDLVERPEVVTKDGRGQRRPQAGLDGGVQSGHDAVERPRPTDRVVDLGVGTVEADLNA